MKVILLKEVRGLGHAGEIKEVSEGYARNFLLGRGLADLVSKHSLDILEAQKNKKERIKKLEVKNKTKLAKKLKGQKFIITGKADEKGSLYSKITAKTIVDELNKQGIKIEEKEINLTEAIKKIGEHGVELNLGGEKVMIKVEVKN
jgi:large subunit ribosomal protein L9